MGEKANIPTSICMDRSMDESLRRVLDGEMALDQFYGMHQLSGHPLESQARMLHILNITFKAVQQERIVLKAIEYLGTSGDILHIPAEDPTMPYLNAVIQKGRLLTPLEYGNMLSSFEGLKILFQTALGCNDKEMIRKVIDRVKTLIPNKAIVLARMNGYTYETVLAEYKERTGELVLLDVDQFLDSVVAKVPDLEVKSDCQLGLSRDIIALDILLSNAELQRTPENRTDFVKQILATSPKFHFVHNNNLRSKAFWEAYPDQFELEDIARPGTKWKCEGDCMGCPNWTRTLSKQSHNYSKW